MIRCASRESLTSLYQLLGRPALSKTLYLIKETQVAEEIVQDTFLKMWQKGLSFPCEKAAYKWVYRTCHNAAIDHLRSHGHARTTALGVDVMTSFKHPESVEDRFENRDTLEKIVANLSKSHCQLLAYRFVDGMKIESIASVMEVNERTIRRRIDAALERCKSIMQEKS